MTFDKGILLTKWSHDVPKEIPWNVYPRPQWKRDNWLNLNGLWNYSITKKGANTMGAAEGQILVPFCIESYLSGVLRSLKPNQRLWYQRTFNLPDGWNNLSEKSVLLHFGAVDWESDVFINGKHVGTHKGGYNSFSYDITEHLKLDGSGNEIVVSVWDPSDKGYQEHGKQTLNPWGINYTPCSGIWKTVWLEVVPKRYLSRPFITPNLDSNSVNIKFPDRKDLATYKLKIKVLDGSSEVAKYEGSYSSDVTIKIPDPKLWSPDNPHLYDLVFELIEGGRSVDIVKSYFGMRKVSLGKDSQGRTVILLNNKPIFQYGPLDQGYWPDGNYTAPTVDALLFDIDITKQMGFNMIRKHIKVEPELWYHHCDKVGMLVWQDMPSGGTQSAGILTNFIFRNKIHVAYGRKSIENQKQYYNELKEMVLSLYNHPSIIIWIPFNEGWGQFGEGEAVDLVRSLDSSRLINHASGWTDKGFGDIHDIHVYPGPGMPPLEEKRAVVLGEFGGLGYPIEAHSWIIKRKWGYRKYTSEEELEKAYFDLMEKLVPLIEKGLCAAVYTQTTDVEGEVNGLWTYDREICKISIEKLAKCHQKFYTILK
jgi:beta-galactosidase/beta-glucuronidase